MFVVGAHYCVQLLPEVIFCFQTSPLPVPLLKLFFFYFLSFFHVTFSGMPNFPKYMMPY